MIIVSNSSPLIALSRIGKLFILRDLFGKIFIPDTVYQETVLQSNVNVQKENIQKAIDDNFIIVEIPKTNHAFKRTIDFGERGVLNLAFDKKSVLLIIDDKKTRNEAKELGFRVVKTSTLLKRSESLHFISSYTDIMSELEKLGIYLPK
ncbi:MAG TPA: hypothetical protein VJL89_03590 [Thermodesulfovibrionia bacterium]|nr:hypothetical protein [Thermodesulfovibrionia bacterium]